jgi:hypothetical protein
MEHRAPLHRARWLAAPIVALALVLTTPQQAAAERPGVRFGMSGAVGGVAGSVDGLYGGGQLRLGVQWTRSFATYGMTQGLIGGFVPPAPGSDVFGVMLNSLMLEGTVGIVQIGFGPAFDFVWGCDGTPSQWSCGSVGPYFGLDARGALRLGMLTLSLDVHPTWVNHDNALVWITFGVGFDV